MINPIIYFDNNATTKVDEEVINTMLPYFNTHYGNAASKLHQFGWVANAAVEEAQQKIAKLINCKAEELIFTSGATESVNLAIKGIFEAYRTKGNHIITCKTEHKAVLDTCNSIQKQGSPGSERRREATLDSRAAAIFTLHRSASDATINPLPASTT